MSGATPPPRKTPEDDRSQIVAFPRVRANKRSSDNNLPLGLSSFVGREREMSEVKRILGEERLLTLTGLGGCGKTRLALEVGRDLAEEFEDGAWLVELAPLSDPDLVQGTVASVLGVREQPNRPLTEALSDHIGFRRILLILDNCEHLTEACAELAEALLRSCPELRILATSREALGIVGESSWIVPSLSLPDPRHLPAAEGLGHYEAARLFVERARTVASSFALTERNATAVAQVCYRLDGIPLAIELAAARAKALSVEQISSRLDEGFRLLKGGGRTADPRQQTLRATIDWSHELLPEEEKVLFRRLSVFTGGFTLGAAEEVCAGEDLERDEVLDLLARLVDKSLVLVVEQQGGEARYRLLETVRRYGLEWLEENGEAEGTGRRHAAFFLALVEQAEPKLRGPEQAAWLRRLETEHDNLRAAIGWSLKHGEVQIVAGLGWSVLYFWWVQGNYAKGRRLMEEALARGTHLPASARAKLLFAAGTMAQAQAEYESAQPLIEESLAVFRQLGDKEGIMRAQGSAGIVALGQKQHEKGISFLEEAIDLALEIGNRWSASLLLGFSATVPLVRGDHARARQLAERGLSLAREIGAREGASVALHTLATIARTEGDHEHTVRLFEEGLTLSVEVGDDTNVAYYLEGLAEIAASEDRLVRAARLWGAAEALLVKIEVTAYPHAPDRSLYHHQLAAARSRLDEAAWTAAWEEGRAMTLEQAIECALERATTLEQYGENNPSV